MELDYELCEQCIKNMEEAGAFGLTLEEMIQEKVHVAATFAIDLAKEGHYVMRDGDTYPFTVRQEDIDGSGKLTPMFCLVDEEYGNVGYKAFTTEELLAEDYIIIK